MNQRILFLGGGNMASALIGGLLQQGFAAADLRVVEISEPARARLREAFGIETLAAQPASIDADIVVLAVKPQQLRQVAGALAGALRGQLVVSIAAGIRTADLARWLGGHRRIVRVMPNTPALVGAGISGMFSADGASASDRLAAQAILGAVGKVVWLDREEQLDIVTAVSGSGPAYVFYFIEALEKAAQESGLGAAVARELAVQTFLGAARLAAGSDEPAAVLRERVTSKGGTTARALGVMEAAGLREKLVEAVHAAESRSRELGDELAQ